MGSRGTGRRSSRFSGRRSRVRCGRGSRYGSGWLPGPVRQAPPFVRGEQGGSCTADVAFVGGEVELGAGGDGEHAGGAGGGQVVGGAGQPIGDPDQPALRVGQPLQVDAVVAVPAGVVPPVVGADPVGAHRRAVEQGEVAMCRPAPTAPRSGYGPVRPAVRRLPGYSGRRWPARCRSRRPAGRRGRRASTNSAGARADSLRQVCSRSRWAWIRSARKVRVRSDSVTAPG